MASPLSYAEQFDAEQFDTEPGPAHTEQPEDAAVCAPINARDDAQPDARPEAGIEAGIESEIESDDSTPAHLLPVLQRRRQVAEYFYGRQMYYRAITAYEELALLTPSSEERAHARLQIAMAYHNAQQFEQAADEYLDLLNQFNLTDDLAGLIRLQRILALIAFEQTLPEAQQRSTLRGELKPLTLHENAAYQLPAKYQLVRLNPLYGARPRAQEQFNELQHLCKNSTAQTCLQLDTLAGAVAQKPPSPKHPWLGATLSTAIPGAGSIYAEHYVDALYYLGLVALGAWTSWELYDTDHRFAQQSPIFYTAAFITTLIYLANILQGYIAVQRTNALTDYNYRQDVVSRTAVPLPLER